MNLYIRKVCIPQRTRYSPGEWWRKGEHLHRPAERERERERKREEGDATDLPLVASDGVSEQRLELFEPRLTLLGLCAATQQDWSCEWNTRNFILFFLTLVHNTMSKNAQYMKCLYKLWLRIVMKHCRYSNLKKRKENETTRQPYQQPWASLREAPSLKGVFLTSILASTYYTGEMTSNGAGTRSTAAPLNTDKLTNYECWSSSS